MDLCCARVEALPYPAGHFTKVSSVNFLFYWEDIRQGLAEIYRVLQTEGQVVLTYTCKKDLAKKGFAQYGVKTYEEEEIHALLVEVGFGELAAFRSADRRREFICTTGFKRLA